MRAVLVCGLALLGCNSGASSNDVTGDGSLADASEDVGIDAPLMTGTLRVRVSAPVYPSLEPTPTVGDNVVFTDQVQTQVVMTDANGEASATVAGSTTVTQAHYVNAATLVLTSVIGAEPGEEIVLRTPPGGDYTILASTVVNFTLQSGATSYQACNSCRCQAAATSPITIEVKEYCRTDPMSFTLLAFEGGDITSYATTTAPYSSTAGAALTMPAQLSPTKSFTGTFTNIPSRVHTIGLSFHSDATNNQRVISMPGISVTTQVRGWDAERSQFAISFVENSNGGPVKAQLLTRPITSATTGVSVDLASALLPWLETPTFDPTTRTLTAPASSGAQGDMYIREVRYRTQTGSRDVTWTLFDAGGSATLQLPTIPPSVADTTHGANRSAYNTIIESDAVSDFAAARRDPLALFPPSFVPGETTRASYSPGASGVH